MEEKKISCQGSKGSPLHERPGDSLNMEDDSGLLFVYPVLFNLSSMGDTGWSTQSPGNVTTCNPFEADMHFKHKEIQ